MADLPVSKHFRLHALAEGIYAAVALPGGAAFSNAGIIDTGDLTLVFDTFELPQAGADLCAAARQLTGRKASVVITSHWHGDHWGGNQEFEPGTVYLSTARIRRGMEHMIAEIQKVQQDPSEMEKSLEQVQQRLLDEKDPRWIAGLESTLVRTRYTLESLSRFRVVLPNQTFSGRLVFHGSQRRVELVSRRGHTASDLVLLIPDAQAAFIGDLGFFQSQPFMAYGILQDWQRVLLRLERSSYAVFVPGHGPLGSKVDLERQRQYMALLEEKVSQVVRAGGTLEQAYQIELPEPFNAWLMGGMGRFQRNIQRLYQNPPGKNQA